MKKLIASLEIRSPMDVVLSGRWSRQITAFLGFEEGDQARIGAAVLECCRNAFEHGGGGRVRFLLERECLTVWVIDQGAGIHNLDELLREESRGRGIEGAKNLMDAFSMESGARGVRMRMSKRLPRPREISEDSISGLQGQLARQGRLDLAEEFFGLHGEYLAVLQEAHKNREELAQLNGELEATNRGVVALHAEMAHRTEFLRESGELKSRFLSNVSHEFRTPLNSILSLSQILLDRLDGDLSGEQEMHVQFIRRAASELMAMVNDLLVLAKVRAGRAVPHPEGFGISDLFGVLRGTLRPLLGKDSAVRLVFEEADHLPPLFTDEMKLSQVLRNLLSNSLKFTEKGEIRVSARLLEGDEILFTVKDTGCGIAAEQQQAIFEEFAQLEEGRAKGSGTGLGLPIARGLTELLGGRITCHSQPGVGTTFQVRLPRVYQGGSMGKIEAAHQARAEGLQVLVCLDETDELPGLLRPLLAEMPIHLCCPRSVVEARECIEAISQAVVLVRLVEHSGWEVIYDLKKNPATESHPLYCLGPEEERERALALGVDAYFTLPMEGKGLAASLEMMIHRT